MRTVAKLDLSNTERFANGVPEAVGREVDRSIPKALAIMQRHHVKKEMIRRRGKKSRGTKQGSRLYYRTGELARSYRISHRRGSLRGDYGSTLHRALILEDGGTIKPRGKYLAIPMPGEKGWPRERNDLFFYIASSGKPALARRDGGKLKVAYLLRRQVKIPARPTLQNTIDKTTGRVFELVGEAVGRGLDDA